ncbi:hypothetical protein BDW22DRAFT_1000116 [Trametopsis cervina]|nr:hypothetical protein BDW22DRAFT_1000116 [Trametopsis cervina]
MRPRRVGVSDSSHYYYRSYMRTCLHTLHDSVERRQRRDQTVKSSLSRVLSDKVTRAHLEAALRGSSCWTVLRFEVKVKCDRSAAHCACCSCTPCTYTRRGPSGQCAACSQTCLVTIQTAHENEKIQPAICWGWHGHMTPHLLPTPLQCSSPPQASSCATRPVSANTSKGFRKPEMNTPNECVLRAQAGVFA